MDLKRAQELLLSPRDLTREQWLEVYETVQEHNIRRLHARADDDEADDYIEDSA